MFSCRRRKGSSDTDGSSTSGSDTEDGENSEVGEGENSEVGGGEDDDWEERDAEGQFNYDLKEGDQNENVSLSKRC